MNIFQNYSPSLKKPFHNTSASATQCWSSSFKISVQIYETFLSTQLAPRENRRKVSILNIASICVQLEVSMNKKFWRTRGTRSRTFSFILNVVIWHNMDPLFSIVSKERWAMGNLLNPHGYIRWHAFFFQAYVSGLEWLFSCHYKSSGFSHVRISLI